MKTYIGKIPIKIGSIVCYKGVKYKVIKIEDTDKDASVVFKTKNI